MINHSQLQAIEKQLRTGSLQCSAGQLGPRLAAQLSQAFPGTTMWWTIDPSSIQTSSSETEESIRFSASAKELLLLEGQSLNGLFFVHNQQVELLLYIPLPLGWNFGWSYPELPDFSNFATDTWQPSFFYDLRFTSDVQLVFTSYNFQDPETDHTQAQSYLTSLMESTLDHSQIAQGLNYIGQIDVTNTHLGGDPNSLLLNTLLNYLGHSDESLPFYGSLIHKTQHDEIRLQLSLDFTKQYKDIFSFGISSLVLHTSASLYSSYTGSGISLLAGATIGDTGNDDSIEFLWPVGSSRLHIQNTKPLSFPGLDTFTSLIEGGEVPTNDTAGFPGYRGKEEENSFFSSLQIREFALHLDLDSSTPVSYISLAIGPEESWNDVLLPTTSSSEDTQDAALSIEDLLVRIEWANGSGHLYLLSAFRAGGGLVNISATFPELQFSGSLATHQTIDVTQLLEAVLPTSVILPSINITDLELSADLATKRYAFELDVNSDWEFELGGLSVLPLKDLYLNLEKEPDVFFATIESIMSIGGVDLILLATNTGGEGWDFSGRTRPYAAIPIGELARYMGSHSRALNSLVFENLAVAFNTATKNFYFHGDTYLEIFDKPVSTSLNIAIEQLNNGYQKTVDGTLLFDNSMEFALHFESGEEVTRFTASYHDSSTEHDLEALLGSLGVENLVSLPELLASLTIKSLDFSYETHSKDFSFSGEVDFTISDGASVALVADVNITHQQDGTTDQSFSGNLTLYLPPPSETASHTLVFDLLFDKQENRSLMLAAYHDANPTEIKLSDLLANIGVTVPDVISLTLHDTVLIHEKISADSANGEPESEESSSESEGASKNLFVINVDGGLNLSNLPLVGKLFPAGQSIVLHAQLLYASSDDEHATEVFSNTDMADINALLPEGISHLNPENDPNKTISQGFDAAFKLQLADQLFVFELPLAVNEKVNDSTSNASANESNGDSTAPFTVDTQASSDSITWFTIQKSMGPVHFNRIGGAYNDGKITFALDASLSMGGLEISLDGLSVRSSLHKFEPHFNIKGLGIDYQNSSLSIGAAFLKEHIGDPAPAGYDEYDGLALIRFKELAISAIGSYAYVNDKPSLFIYAALNYPIGGPPIFFVTGLSLGFGYNRGLRIPSIDKVAEFPMVAEAINGTSLPDDAGKETLTAELEAIHAYIPIQEGQMFLAVGISFTSYELIESFVLVTANFGNRFELDVLGISTLILPPNADTNKEPLAFVQLAIKASLVPDEGFFGVRAQLTSESYIFSKDCHLTGGFAFYIWYDGPHEGDFIVSIGGYHPHFQKPAHYPNVPRLGFNWALDSHASIKGDMYLALCGHAFMAGGHLEANYHSGALKAWFKAGADFLIEWKPYHYEASLYIDIGASYTYHFFGTHHITVDLGANVDIWGPDFGGHAKIHLWIVSIGVDFGASRVRSLPPIEWDEFKESFLPATDKLCSISVGKGLVSKGPDDNHLGIINPKELCLITDAFIPSSTVTWGDAETINGFNPDFGISPMDKKLADISCSQVIEIKKMEGNNWTDWSSNFSYTIITKNKPAGLWGIKRSSDLNDPQLIRNTFAGLRIVPEPDELGQAVEIERSFVSYETSPLSDAIVWKDRPAFTTDTSLDEAATKEKINDSITGNEQRNTLLEALNTQFGMEFTMDLSNTLANDLILKPELELHT
jgi:hypothetical protein